MAELATPAAIRVAATLRLADHFAEGHTSVHALAGVCAVDEKTLERLLAHLVQIDLFRLDQEDSYSLTPPGAALLSDDAAGLRARLDMRGAVGRADLAFIELLHSVETGEPAYSARYGRSFWEDLAATPELAESFDNLMGADVGRESEEIVAAYDWGSLQHVVDVGGGNGRLLQAMLTSSPTLRGTVVDLPAAAAAARLAFAEAAISDRADAIAASFFDPLPADRGGYLLSAILHNWNDHDAQAILRRCAEAAGETGRTFVIERAGGARVNTERDLRMLVYFGGRERSAAEIAGLAAPMGLTARATYRAGPNEIVELVATSGRATPYG